MVVSPNLMLDIDARKSDHGIIQRKFDRRHPFSESGCCCRDVEEKAARLIGPSLAAYRVVEAMPFSLLLVGRDFRR